VKGESMESNTNKKTERHIAKIFGKAIDSIKVERNTETDETTIIIKGKGVINVLHNTNNNKKGK
jgi:hypothetical protein